MSVDVRIPPRRALRQVPRAHAARFEPVRVPALSREAGGLIFFVTQIEEAPDHARRAAILLRIPDALILSEAVQLAEACGRRGFALGAQFVTQRVVALHAVRDREGQLPAHVTRTQEIWRQGLVAVAGGMGNAVAGGTP